MTAGKQAVPAGSVIASFRELYGTLSRQRRRHLMLAVVLMLAGALAELVTIGAVLPFLALLASPEGAERLPVIGALFGLLGLQNHRELILAATALLIGAALATAAVRLAITWFTQDFVMKLGHELGTTIFGRILRQPYAYYVTRNSSEVIAGMEKVQNLVSWVLLPAIQGASASVIALCIAVLLFAIDPFTAIVATASVGLLYLLVSILTQPRLARNSGVISSTATKRVKAVQEGLGGIRDILLESSQPVFEERFRSLDLRFRRAVAHNAFIGTAPRFIIEAAGIALIALLALAMSSQPEGLVAALPVLGAMALGAQRLLPLLQTAYVGWSQVTGNASFLADILKLMKMPVVTSLPRSATPAKAFEQEVRFENVSYRYPNGHLALRNIDLVIPKGARVGLVGRTGSGKSTLIDLLMGLLDPSSGAIRIDGHVLGDATRGDWQAQIAHVPQSIYLADTTIASNIAFGESEERVDQQRVRDAAERAAADEFIAALPEGYESFIGERGVRLSGGQRQRIGLARALYKGANLLILDEATSALDSETEAAVMESVARLGRDVTVVMIAHRISTLAGCDSIVRLEAGKVAQISAPGETPRARNKN